MTILTRNGHAWEGHLWGEWLAKVVHRYGNFFTAHIYSDGDPAVTISLEVDYSTPYSAARGLNRAFARLDWHGVDCRIGRAGI